jgi:hypothetical protein
VAVQAVTTQLQGDKVVQVVVEVIKVGWED